MSNDTGSTIFAFYVISASGNKFTTNGSAFASIPGATFDGGDLPLGFTYINFPVGIYNVGNVVVPNTPLSDLRAYYRQTFSSPEVGVLTRWFPEPSGLTLFGIGAIFAAVRRRRSILHGQ